MESNWERNLKIPKTHRSCTKKQVIGFFVFLVVILALWLGLILGLILKLNKDKKPEEIKPVPPLPSCAGEAVIYKYAAVSSEVKQCSDIGSDFLATKDASAIDAAIATQLCVGVLNFQRSGIGGNMMMTYFSKKENKIYTLNAMGTAPGNIAGVKKFEGAASITVPGAIAGYALAHKKFGKLPWKDLFQPAIKLAKDGFPLTRAVYMSAMETPQRVNKSAMLKAMLMNGTKPMAIGTTLRNVALAQTLEAIANNGADEFYNGTLATKIVDEIQKKGGLISADDLSSYEAKWVASATLSFPPMMHDTLPPPSGGVLVMYILNILKGYGMNASSMANTADKTLVYHRMVEAMKMAFENHDKIADPSVQYDYVKMLLPAQGDAMRMKIKGTSRNLTQTPETRALPGEASHLSLIAANGDAVSMTNSLDMVFGAQFVGTYTGVLYNDAMVSFVPSNITAAGTSNNQPAPRKQPYSPMAPIIVTQDGEAKIIIGAGGGARAITALSTILVRAMWFGESPKYAVDAKRLHNQKTPNVVFYEKSFDKAVLEGLEKLKHIVKDYEYLKGNPANVQMVMKWKNSILAYGSKNYGTCPSGY